MNMKLLSTCLLLAAAACAHQPPAKRETTLRYSYFLSGKVAGEQVVTSAGRERTVHFAFNDRGRGPETTSHYRLDEREVPLSLRTTGVEYLKAPIDETFDLANGRATWKNNAESGSAAVAGAAPFFVSMYGPPEELAMLVRAAMHGGGRVSLLPAGQATISRLETRAVAFDGETANVTHYTVSGIGLTPTSVWLDEELELFADVSSWASVVRAGAEEGIPQLLAAQDATTAQHFGSIARRATATPSAATVFRNVRLFDSLAGESRDGMTVVVSGERITAVAPAQEVVIPAGAKVIDGEGKTLLPGLWDMHAHVGDLDGILDIAAGVTSVRDLANDIDALLELKRKWDANQLIGPRIVMAGFIDGPGPFAGPTKMLVSTEDEVRQAIEKYASLGFEQIKVYSSIKPELVPSIVRIAHEKGMRVSGHIPAFMRAEEAVLAGFDEIQHANMLFLNFMPDVGDTRTPARFTAVGERGGALDLDSEEVRQFIALLKQRGVVIDPTVNIFESLFVSRRGVMHPGYGMIADRLPPNVRRGFLTGGLPIADEETGQKYRAAFRRMLELVALLHRSGVTLVPGTDAFTGFALHRELELWAEAGIPPAEVLRAATIVSARVARRDHILGSITPGKLADLILVNGDPATRISDIRNLELTMKGGVLYDTRALYREVGVQ